MRKLFDQMNASFYSAYHQFEDEPSPQVWENIAAQLDALPAKRSIILFYKKIFIVLLMISGAGILIDLAFRSDNDYTSKAGNYDSQNKSGHDKKKELFKPENIDHRGNITVYHENDNNEIAGKRISFPSDEETTSLSTRSFKSLPPVNLKWIPVEDQFSGSMADRAVKINFNTTLITHRSSSTKFLPSWSVSAVSSYGHSAYRLDSDLPSNYQQINLIRQRERSDLSYSGGLYITCQLYRKFGLRSGLIYSNTDIDIDPQKIYAYNDPDGGVGFQLLTSTGYAFIKPKFTGTPDIGDSLTTTGVKHRFRSISIPLILKYSAGNGRLSFYPGAGIAANFILHAGLETEVEDASHHEMVKVDKLKGTGNFFWSIHADTEIRYGINPRLSASFHPSVNFAVSPITDNNIVETFPYTISAGLGVNYKF